MMIVTQKVNKFVNLDSRFRNDKVKGKDPLNLNFLSDTKLYISPKISSKVSIK